MKHFKTSKIRLQSVAIFLFFFCFNTLYSQVVFNKEYALSSNSITGIYITKIVQDKAYPYDYYFVGNYRTSFNNGIPNKKWTKKYKHFKPLFLIV